MKWDAATSKWQLCTSSAPSPPLPAVSFVVEPPVFCLPADAASHTSSDSSSDGHSREGGGKGGPDQVYLELGVSVEHPEGILFQGSHPWNSVSTDKKQAQQQEQQQEEEQAVGHSLEVVARGSWGNCLAVEVVPEPSTACGTGSTGGTYTTTLTVGCRPW